MPSYSNSSSKRIPFDEWKRLHPEKYGPQRGRGSYTVGRGKYSTKKMISGYNKSRHYLAQGARDVRDSPFGKTFQQQLATAIVKAGNPLNYTKAVSSLAKPILYAGRGSYKTNSLINGDSTGQVAKHNGSTDEHGSILVEKREFVTSINATGSADFSCQSFSINPALKSVFPWLSQTATNFDEYEMVQCIFEYEPVISDMSVSSVGSLGTIVLAANYNAGSPKFTSFPAMIEYGGAVRGRISDNINCGIEADPTKLANDSHLYTRSGSVPDGQDIKTYDLAKFQLGMYGVPTAYVAGTQLGLLFVRYVVRLSKPKLYDSLGLGISTDQFAGSVGCTQFRPLGTEPKGHNANSIGGFLTKTGNTEYIFPDNFVGTVEVFFYCRGTVAPVGQIFPFISAETGSNIVPVSSYPFSATTSSTNVQTVGGTVVQTMSYMYKVGLPKTLGLNKLQFSSSDIPGGDVVFGLTIREVNPSFKDFYTNCYDV